MNLLDREHSVFFSTYKRIPIEIDGANGVYLYDTLGKQYLDFFAGLAVNALGHTHPRIVSAVERQIRRYGHLSNYYLQDVQIELAEKLVAASGLSRVFLSNSGAEANEGAFKLARKWGDGKGKRTLIGFTNSFHGRTFAALSVMSAEKYKAGLAPMVGDTQVIPYNDTAALRATVNEQTCAVILEAIQGEGGIVCATQEFINALQDLRKEFNFLIIADEIQCGLGRTGMFFGYEHFGMKPDIVTVAKALGGGLPLGAILGSDTVAEVWHPGDHGTTFGGNPIACAAGIAVLDELSEGLMDCAATMGAYLHEQLHLLKAKHAVVTEVRGVGLMAGINLSIPGDAAVVAMRERGILINCTHDTVLRFLPPLIIEREHVDTVVAGLDGVLV
jgi:acetylornithine/N-succinyldiaminopimelate aminotransferase